MASTLEALADRAARPDDLVAAGEVIDLRFPHGGRTLSARASKLFHLLVQSAAGSCADDRLHRIPIAWLRNTGLGHLTIDEFIACIRELASVTIDVEVRDEPGRAPHVKTGAFLAHIERDLDAARGELLYEFSRTMRYVFRRSAYWAVLDRRATLAFESRYAIRLYELMSLRAGLTRKHEELFAIPELRARLGVPDGKLTRWVHLRQKALEPAVAEVNHLSPFTVSWAAVKHGRAVGAVRFSWVAKSAAARAAAGAELASRREGRRERRAAGDRGGEGEVVVPLHAMGSHGAPRPAAMGTAPKPEWDAGAVPFTDGRADEWTDDRTGRHERRPPSGGRSAVSPAPSPAPSGEAVRPAPTLPRAGAARPEDAFPEGPIRYTRWAELVRAHAPRPTPDVDLVGASFRRFAADRGVPLRGARCERAFVGYCAKFKVR